MQAGGGRGGGLTKDTANAQHQGFGNGAIIRED